MDEPRWITKAGLLILHEDSISEHGGSRGMRDEGLLDSALAPARNLFLYQEQISLAQMAAAYAYGIAKNHPFVDGNKRAAFAAMNLFLEKNGERLIATEVDATLMMLRLAAGEVDESAFGVWIAVNLETRTGSA